MPTTELNHPDDAALLRAFHEPSWAEPELLAHLAGCATCRERQQEMITDDGEVGMLLTALDHPLPSLRVEDVTRRITHPMRRRMILAAEITLVVAAAAAAMTLPISPLSHLFFGKTPVVITGGDSAATAASSPPAAPAPVGISLPAPASLDVEFRHVQGNGVMEVHLIDGDQVIVRSRGGTVGFTVNEGKVLIDNRVAADEYYLDIPVTLRRARIVMGGRVLFHKDGDRSGPVLPTDDGRYRLTFTDTLRN